MFGLGLFKKDKPAVHDPNAPQMFGPFSLHELINRGGAAEIWTATRKDSETFALRRLLKNGAVSDKAREQFLNGCEVLSKIHHHQFIINYLEHGKVDGVLFLLMERVEGSNLKQLIGKHDPILAEFIGNILIDMAIALEQVHDSGFMHLDFKPENVLVTRNGDIRLIDFDLAQPKPDKPKRLSTNAGTPAYMAPEQLRKEPLDHRADMFSFGVTAYEALTFRKPFTGSTPEEILRRQLDVEHPIPRPREFNADIPIALERTIMKCLERDPEKRYPYTSVLVRDLSAALYVK